VAGVGKRQKSRPPHTPRHATPPHPTQSFVPRWYHVWYLLCFAPALLRVNNVKSKCFLPPAWIRLVSNGRFECLCVCVGGLLQDIMNVVKPGGLELYLSDKWYETVTVPVASRSSPVRRWSAIALSGASYWLVGFSADGNVIFILLRLEEITELRWQMLRGRGAWVGGVCITRMLVPAKSQENNNIHVTFVYTLCAGVHHVRSSHSSVRLPLFRQWHPLHRWSSTPPVSRHHRYTTRRSYMSTAHHHQQQQQQQQQQHRGTR